MTVEDMPHHGAGPSQRESVNRTPIGPGPETHGGRREPIDETANADAQALEPVGDSPRRPIETDDRKPVGDESGGEREDWDGDDDEVTEKFDAPAPREPS